MNYTLLIVYLIGRASVQSSTFKWDRFQDQLKEVITLCVYICMCVYVKIECFCVAHDISIL